MLLSSSPPLKQKIGKLGVIVLVLQSFQIPVLQANTQALAQPSASPPSINNTSVTDWEAIQSTIAERCQQAQQRLYQASTQQTNTVQISQLSDRQAIKRIETPLVNAQNVLFEAYLLGNVTSSAQVKANAENCQLTLKPAIDRYIGSQYVGVLANRDSKDLHTPQAIALKKYQQQHIALSNLPFAKKKADANAIAMLFRGIANSQVIQDFSLPLNCQSGLTGKYHKRLVSENGIKAKMTGSNFASLLKRMDQEKCRIKAYQQYQGRHIKVNQSNLLEMIKLRHQAAQMLGMSSWGEYSLTETTLHHPQQVRDFLNNLSVVDEKTTPATFPSPPWNERFETAQQVGKSNSANKSKQSLSKEAVLNGLWLLLKEYFALTVKPVEEQAWHSSVLVFDLYSLEHNKRKIGRFYLDLHPREGKYTKNRHRAIRRGVADLQTPASALILNLPQKQWRQRHIKSLYHEFGHLLHNLVAVQDFHILSGISLEPDLIEMPAKWFEWLSYEPSVQKFMFGQTIMAPVKTDAGPRFQFRLYRAGTALDYFSQPDINTMTHQDLTRINQSWFKNLFNQALPENCDSQYSFSHLATYGPRYFSYIWSEVVARKLLNDYLSGDFNGQDFVNIIMSSGSLNPFIDNLNLLYTTGKTAESNTSGFKQLSNNSDLIKWATLDHE